MKTCTKSKDNISSYEELKCPSNSVKAVLDFTLNFMNTHPISLILVDQGHNHKGWYEGEGEEDEPPADAVSPHRVHVTVQLERGVVYYQENDDELKEK